jgi:PKD repeat protein
VRVAIASAFLLVGPLLVAPATVSADPGDIGQAGPIYTGSGSAPTGSKPESKLWFNDGIWWGSLWSQSAVAFHIWRLDLGSGTWVDTGVALDDRTGTRDDVLWDGSKLYVASHRYSTAPASGYAVRLYRFSYDPVLKRYTPDAGYPATIHNFKTETFVIDKDTTGTLWATWVQNNQVYVSHSNGADNVWVTPYTLPGEAAVNADDISSVIAFRRGGDPGRIGVMWSNQVDAKVHFAFHNDGDPDTTWDSTKTAIQGPGIPDDHINLKSLGSDGSGRVYAAIKTGLTSSSSPLIMLLTFDPATMAWTSSTVARVSDGHTRPIVVIDDGQKIAHVFLTGPVPPDTNGDSGGAIYEKTSPLANLSFPLGVGTTVIRDASDPGMNNATSTKQNVNASTGVVVLAGDDNTNQYWWHFDPLGGGPPAQDPPVAAFTANPSSGPAPLNVSFTDQSTNLPTSWAWDFDTDGTVDSTLQNPSFTYGSQGTYTATLTATNAAGSNATSRTISVGAPLAFQTFTPVADAFVSQQQATKNYGNDANLRVRSSNSSFVSYLRFNVAGLGGSVGSVRLRLFVTDVSTNGGTVYPTSNTWTESGTGSINWNNAPALGSAIKAIGPTTAAGTWTEVDLGPVIGGNGTYSFAIAGGSTNSAYYSSRQGANPAQLVVGLNTAPPSAPVANFTATPTSGGAPLTVNFTDQSTNIPTSWAWDFTNDGTTDSTVQNPSTSYETPGTYSIKLTVSNAAGTDTVTRTDFVTVTTGPPPPSTATFTSIADTRTNQSSPSSTTGGTDVSLRVRLDPTGSYRTYVRFSVAGLVGTVTSAKLRLWCTDASPNGGTVYPTNGNWSEATTNWSNAPAATGGAAGTALNVVAGAWAEFDVTSVVSGNGQVDLLVSDGNTNSAFYSSREGPNTPQLVVTTSS